MKVFTYCEPKSAVKISVGLIAFTVHKAHISKKEHRPIFWNYIMTKTVVKHVVFIGCELVTAWSDIFENIALYPPYAYGYLFSKWKTIFIRCCDYWCLMFLNGK